LEYSLPKADCILLECIRFIEPIIPEGFTPPTIEEVRATRHNDNNDDLEDGRKTKKRKLDTARLSATNGVNGTGTPAAQPSINGGHPGNDYANAPAHAHAHSYAQTQAQAQAPVPSSTSASNTPQQTPSSAATAAQAKALTPTSAAYPPSVSITQSRTIFDQPGSHRPGNHPFGRYSGNGAYSGNLPGGLSGSSTSTPVNRLTQSESIPQTAVSVPVLQFANGLSRVNAVHPASSGHDM